MAKLRFKTEDDVLSAFRDRHGNKFSYKFSDCFRVHDYVNVICPIHGENRTKIQDHLLHDCFKCAAKIKNNKKILTIDEFKERATKAHGTRYMYDFVDYVGMHTEIKIVCSNHGVFLQRPYSHLNGSGCPLCANEDNANARLRVRL